jgi:glycosyltransferase involved in cell wall biosynthesis
LLQRRQQWCSLILSHVRSLEGRNIVRVHVVVPEGFDDPGQPTGGNIYDRRACAGLAEAGWDVLVRSVAAAWPVPSSGARAGLAAVVSAVPDGETVLIDGLIASPAAAQLLPHAGRMRMTVLLHMPLATASERAVLRAAAGVVATSEWTRQQVLTRYAIPAHLVHVARPGVDRVDAPARPVRGRLICVGVLGRHKGQDVLVEALADLAERDWHCVLAGPLDRDPDFVHQLQTRITRLGYGHRIRLAGILTGAALKHAYTTADLLVAPSRSETYGMAVTEALAHGLPVIAAAVGGLPEALGFAADGTRPGQLVPPGDPAALAAALGDWLGDERHRHRLRAAARQRRSTLHGWEQTTQEIANALTAHGSLKPVPPGVIQRPGGPGRPGGSSRPPRLLPGAGRFPGRIVPDRGSIFPITGLDCFGNLDAWLCVWRAVFGAADASDRVCRASRRNPG